MNECLITRLKTSVEDSSIPKLGGLMVSVRKELAESVSTSFFGVSFANEKGLVEVLNGGFFTDSSLTQNLGTSVETFGGTYYLKNSKDLEVSPKYKLRKLSAHSLTLDIEGLKFSPYFEEIESPKGGDLTGDISVFADKVGLKKIDCPNTKLYGDLSSLSNCTSLEYLRISSTKISGNIISLAKATNIKSINTVDTDVTGEVNDFVSAQIANGRTEGTISMAYAKNNSKITFNGIPLNVNSDLPTNNNDTSFSWSANGIVTWA